MKPKLFYFLLHLIPILLFISFLIYIVYAFRPSITHSLDPVSDRSMTGSKRFVIIYPFNYGNTPPRDLYPVTDQLHSPRYHYLLSPTSELIPSKRQSRKISSLQKEQALLPTPQNGECPIEKIARGVAQAETQDCTKGVGLTRNNCFGIRNKKGFITYKTKEDSYRAFESLWTRKYGGCPTLAQARKYTNNDHPERWLKIVYQYIYE